MQEKQGLRIALVYSKQDPAGVGVASRLMGEYGFRECKIAYDGSTCKVLMQLDAILAGFEEDVLELGFLDRVLDADAYIVLSRHSSTSGEPTLSLHHPGNPTPKAEHGGRPRELAWAFPRLAKTLLLSYHRIASEEGLLDEYRFTLEATHHGPTELTRPIIFIEIGSREKQWQDPRAQNAMAIAVAEALERGPSSCIPVVGVGGTHYPDKHTKLMLEQDYCYGHIFAKYVFPELEANTLAQGIEKSVDRIEKVIMLKVPSRIRRMVEEVAKRKGVSIELYK